MVSDESEMKYPATGFYPLDKWSKLLLSLILIFSLVLFVPVFIDNGLQIGGEPWLFYTYPISIFALPIIWLILVYWLVT